MLRTSLQKHSAATCDKNPEKAPEQRPRAGV